MGVPYVGDDRCVRPCDLCQVVDLAQMVHAHLDDSDLVLLFQLQQHAGNAEIVVEIPGGLQHIEPGGEDRRDHVLGGGLAHAACHPDHGDMEFPSVTAGQVSQGQGGVLYKDVEAVRFIAARLSGDQAACGPFFQGAGNKAVGVVLFSHDGDKKVSLRAFPVVCLYAGKLFTQVLRSAHKAPARGFQQFFYGHGNHLSKAPSTISSHRSS